MKEGLMTINILLKIYTIQGYVDLANDSSEEICL